MNACQTCGFELWVPVKQFRDMSLGLYSDAAYPGRCILSLDDHYGHLHELPPHLAMRFIRTQQIVSQAIMEVTGCLRVNVAVLGNTESHVHAHLIPRFVDESAPHRTPWEQPGYATRGKLTKHRLNDLYMALREVLG